MHQDEWNSGEFVIELPQIEFNPETFLEQMQGIELTNYVSAYGKPTGLQVSYAPELIQTQIVKHYLDVLKDFNIPIGDIEANHAHGQGLYGWSYIKTKANASLQKHTDAVREASITFPLTFPQKLNFYSSEYSTEKLIYEYKPVIVIINAKHKWHSVDPTNEPRLQFQLDCFNTWDEIKEIVKAL